MTFELFRRNTTFRALPAWIIVSALSASALEGVRTLLAVPALLGEASMAHGSSLLVIIFWLPLAAFLTFGRTNQRCSRFDLTMPIPASRLWWIHLAAVTSSGVALMLAVTGVIRLRDGLVARFVDGAIVPASDLAPLALPLIAGFMLAVAVLQTYEPTLYRIPTSKRYVLTSVLGAALYLGLLMTLVALPQAFVVVPFALAGIIVWRGSRSIPNGFTLIPRRPGAEANAPRPDPAAKGHEWVGTTPRRRGRAVRRLAVMATAFGVLSRGIPPGALWKVPVNLAQVPMMFVWGLVLSGVWFGGEDIWLFFVVITVYLLLTFLAAPLAQLHLIDPLPISRRQIFALLALPGFLATAAGYGAGILATRSDDRVVPAIELTADRSWLVPHERLQHPTVRVPFEALAIAGNGVAPVMVSPWGETHEPWATPLARGTRAVLYSPYGTPEVSSTEFVALQLSRAIRAVYGASLSPNEVGRRFLAPDGSGSVAWRKEAFTAWLAEESLLRRPVVPLFPALFTTIGALWLITMGIFLQSFRATRSDSSRKWTFFGLLGILLVLHIAVTLGSIGTVTEPWIAVGVSRMVFRRLAEVLPGGAAGLWVSGVMLIGLLYGLAQRRFERIEVSAPRTAQEG